MTKDEIIRMARAAGLFVPQAGIPEGGALYRFANLVAAAEREACALIAEEVGDDDEDCHAWTAADAIRARGEE